MSRVLPFLKIKVFYIKRCFPFSCRKPKEITLFFWARSFQKSSFCCLEKVFDTNLLEKRTYLFFRSNNQWQHIHIHHLSTIHQSRYNSHYHRQSQYKYHHHKLCLYKWLLHLLQMVNYYHHSLKQFSFVTSNVLQYSRLGNTNFSKIQKWAP